MSATPLGEIIFFAEVLEGANTLNSTLVIRDTPVQFGSGFQFDSMASSSGSQVVPTLEPVAAAFFDIDKISPVQAGRYCINLAAPPANLAIHRNIAAWIAVTLAAIGIIGNIFSLFVLFRIEPRSPTDVYMMHLAAYDVVYEIFFALVISSRTWWSVRSRTTFAFVLVSLICRPLIDLFSNLATVVVTVFAMERLLAVYRPLQILNSSANKRVLWLALGIATVITLPDFFEFSILAIEASDVIFETVAPTSISVTLSDDSAVSVDVPMATVSNLTRHMLNWTPLPHNESGTPTMTAFAVLPTASDVADLPLDDSMQRSASSSAATPPFGRTLYCYYRTQFAKTSFYETYVLFYTVAFTFIPLLLLIFANGFLIYGVARAAKARSKLTKGQRRPSAASKSPDSHYNSANPTRHTKHQSDQNRLTLMLVMIVLVFTVCQLPIALLAIYSLANELETLKKLSTLVLYSNILVVVFSTTNFALYSAFSRRFRETFKEMITRMKRSLGAKDSAPPHNKKGFAKNPQQPNKIYSGGGNATAATRAVKTSRSNLREVTTSTPKDNNSSTISNEERRPMLEDSPETHTNATVVLEGQASSDIL